LQAKWHTFNKVFEMLRVDFHPAFFQSIEKTVAVGHIALVNVPIQNRPQIFYWIQVRALGRPVQYFNTRSTEVSSGFVGGVFRVIVLLKNKLRTQANFPRRLLQISFQNADIYVCRHNAIDFDEISNTVPRKTSPNIDTATSVLHRLL
jgi:hypothetical protein